MRKKPPINSHADIIRRARGLIFGLSLPLLTNFVYGGSQRDYRLQSCLSIQYEHGDLCKHLGIDSSTDHSDRYSNQFLNAYINRHVHAKYLRMI